jgi:hypothetical protein
MIGHQSLTSLGLGLTMKEFNEFVTERMPKPGDCDHHGFLVKVWSELNII